MNEDLQIFARDQLKNGLAQCTDGEKTLFKRMYSFPNGVNKPADLEKDIDSVVDDMDAEKLDWAMQQVSRTLKKRATDEDKQVQGDG